MWWDNRRPNEMAFVKVKTLAARPKGSTSQPETREVKVVIQNNVCVGPLPLTDAARFDEGGNLLLKTVAEAGFADPARFDFSLKPGSPCVNKGVDPGKVGEFSLKPDLQYVRPRGQAKRPDDGKMDVGAFELAPAVPSPR